jgi:hypothetical protein
MQGQALIASITAGSLRASGLRAHGPRPSPAGFLPKEHGSWSLVLEPLALGLLVAPSLAGGALATAAFAGFLARRPLKAALAPESSERCCAARQTVVLLSALAVAGLFETVATAGWMPLWPLLLAAPLGGLFAWFDAQGESRAAAAELAGSAAFAILPAVLAVLAGWPAAPALALAVVALGRSLPTVLTIRTCLRLRKGELVSPITPLLATSLAGATLLVLALMQLVPPLAVGGAALLFVRSVWFTSTWRPQWSARRFGVFEAMLGILCLALAVIAYLP